MPEFYPDLKEYIHSLKDGRKIGVIAAIRHGHDSVFVTWSKYNEDMEAKPFNEELAMTIAQDRYDLWATGVESKKKIPVEIQDQMSRFLMRCEKYFKNCTIHILGTYAEVTDIRVNKLKNKKFWAKPTV